jgi:hypothetical protein
VNAGSACMHADEISQGHAVEQKWRGSSHRSTGSISKHEREAGGRNKLSPLALDAFQSATCPFEDNKDTPWVRDPLRGRVA